MRINVYAEELTQEVETVVKQSVETGRVFYGVRMFLASPSQLHHTAKDDDRSAITIWVPWNKVDGYQPKTVTGLLRKMADELDAEFATPQDIVDGLNGINIAVPPSFDVV